MKSANLCLISILHRDSATYLKIIAISAILLAASLAQTATVTWLPTGGTNDWFVETNWSSSTWPTNGDDVIINVAGVTNWVLLTNSTAPLGSLLISNKCTLIFSNWATALSATNVSILSNASMTCVGPFSNNVMSNRVYIICSNITVAAGGNINVDYKGYYGGNPASQTGQGPGGAIAARAGGSYGGAGGNYGWWNGAIYGSANAPEYAGSGGGYNPVNAEQGKRGGGAVRIDASGTVTLNGLITANGEGGSSNGGEGSGGAVWISCLAITGAQTIANTCMIRANGGSGSSGTGGAGGGGRIAIVYNTTAQATNPVPPLNLSVLGGTYSYKGELGTIYVPDGQLLTETATLGKWNGEVQSPGLTSWTATNLVVSNCTIRFPAAGFRLAVSNNLGIVTNGVLYLGGDSFLTNASVGLYGPYVFYASTTAGPSLTVSGNLVVTNNGQLHVYGGVTNNNTADYGSLVSVQGDVMVYSGAWIYPVSHPTNGGSVLFSLNNLYIRSGGGIYAYARGFAGGGGATAFGPGKGGSRSGGGYGGGGGYTFSGAIYGDSNAPTQPGSGGGRFTGTTPGGNGGGLIRVIARDSITIDGSLSAGGDVGDSNAGAGSGGGIHLRCRSFGGTNISLSAVGGNAQGGTSGGGGGGRIAVWRMYSSGAITTNVSGGTAGSYPGTNGTVVLGWIPVPGTIFTMH